MKKVVFYGDSNTYGYDPRNYIPGRYPKEVRWIDRLQKAEKSRWEILADGMNGRTIPPDIFYGRADQNLPAYLPTDLFAVMLGSNDLLRTAHPDPLHVAENMKNFMHSLQALSKRQEAERGRPFRLLLIAPPHSGGEKAGEEQMRLYFACSIEMNRRFGRLAEETGAFFVDAADWGIDLAYDGIHFSEAGHRQFARQMENVLAQIEECLA